MSNWAFVRPVDPVAGLLPQTDARINCRTTSTLGVPMERVLLARERIYDHIQDFSACHWFDRATHGDWIVYCVAKDTIQDTAETLLTHRGKGFSTDVYARYFEYYGILQAAYLQQDAVFALYRLFFKKAPDVTGAHNWNRLRDLRNDTAGHPVGRRRFLNRHAIGYDNVSYSWWNEGDRHPRSEDVPLGTPLDGFADEAASLLEDIHAELERSCATKHT